MDAQLKAKWVEALRSGKFKQGRGGLHAADRYCCLGVLCEAGELGEWVIADYEDDDGSIKTTDEFVCHFKMGGTDEALLPSHIREALGIPLPVHALLWKMNDDLNKSFAEIADYIEENIPSSEVNDDR